MKRIEREEYLEFLKNHKDKQIIKDKYKQAGKFQSFLI